MEICSVYMEILPLYQCGQLAYTAGMQFTYAIRNAEVLVPRDPVSGEPLANPVLPAPLPGGLETHAIDRCAFASATNPDQVTLAFSFTADTPTPDGFQWLGLRELINKLPEDDWLPAARAMAYAQWHRNNQHCGRCGGPTKDQGGEPGLVCTACSHLMFPRLSPAILAVVVRDGKLLLARNAANTQGFWSLIAGFVEPGERFEDCVRREVMEEVGIEVRVDAYLGSQPWPFPDQLMIGFAATWIAGELKPDGVEIAEAGWFAPDQLPKIPRSGSLSRRLIDQACADLAKHK